MQKFITLFALLLALATGATNALQCLTCDSATDPSCGYSHNDTVSVPVVECDAAVGQCFIANVDAETDRIVRGCNTAASNTNYCDQFGCFLCPEDQCNDQQYIEERCTSCVSDPSNNFCEWNVEANNEAVICPDTTAERSGCFLQIQGSVYTRDCVANLTDELFESCQSGDDCKICHGDNCNKKEEFQRCYSCDSEVDENCVYRPDGYYIKTCPNYDDTCVSFAVANGKTGRGCTSDIDTEPTYCPGTNCVECSAVECNSILVPSYRITCYQCTADQFGCTHGQEMFQSYKRACKNFNFQDECYTYEDGNDFYRGCMSDESVQSQICTETPERCEICSENDCNSKAVTKQAQLGCRTCTGDACFLESGPILTQCQKAVQPGEVEACYYAKFVDGSIQMGCSLDDGPFEYSTEFVTCTGDNCNLVYAPKKSELLCHQCLDTDENCPWRQREPEQAVTCNSALLYGEVDSCYYYRYQTGHVRRGCLKDEASFCFSHDCQTCTGSYCNSQAESQSCIQCNSSQEMFATCGEDASELNAMPCAEAAFPEDTGCYSVKGDDDVVIRGCWNEATEEHKTFCAAADNEERCYRCTGVGCNTDDHSGSGLIVAVLPLILLSGLIALLA